MTRQQLKDTLCMLKIQVETNQAPDAVIDVYADKIISLIGDSDAGANVPLDRIVMPCGLTEKDTLKDALERADNLAGPDSYSGSLCDRKDLRRIVLLAYEYRKLKQKA